MLSVISVSVLARRILAAIYGLVGMAVLVTNLLETIRDVGTGIAVLQQPISDVRTMDEIVAGETESRALQTRVLMTFTGVAILLAGLGIYRLLSFTVSPREQEFGIRMALGARQGDIFKMVLGEVQSWRSLAWCRGSRWRILRRGGWTASWRAPPEPPILPPPHRGSTPGCRRR